MTKIPFGFQKPRGKNNNDFITNFLGNPSAINYLVINYNPKTKMASRRGIEPLLQE